jgi:radical SAM superfamily enzyme YgiQ (UPF0313 family)
MKVLLTHGYFLNEDPKEQEIMKPYPPLGILYIAAYLEQHGFANQVFDSTFSDFEKLKAHILSHRPDAIGIYTNLMTKLNVLRLIEFIKASGLTTKIILGGPEVRYHRENFLKHGADFIIIGEGEETMLQLLQTIKANSNNYAAVKGIAFKNSDGATVINEERELIKDLDALPLPDRPKIDLQKYFDTWKTAHGHSVISVSTMRGCPYDCKWCSRAVYGQSYRRRSAKAVVEEIQWLQQHYTFDRIWFVDDVFTINYPWLRQFAAEVQKASLKVEYEIITRADRMNESIIQLLKQSGCFRIWIGAESGSQKIIDAMSRRVKIEQVQQMIQLSRHYGLQAGTFIMLGYPGETQQDIADTLHHLKTSNPDLYTLTVAYPIKGTPLYTETESRFIAPLPWETSTDRQIDFTRTYSRRYYDYAIRWIYNEVAIQKNLQASKYARIPVLKAKSIAAQAGMQWHKLVSA